MSDGFEIQMFFLYMYCSILLYEYIGKRGWATGAARIEDGIEKKILEESKIFILTKQFFVSARLAAHFLLYIPRKCVFSRI